MDHVPALDIGETELESVALGGEVCAAGFHAAPAIDLRDVGHECLQDPLVENRILRVDEVRRRECGQLATSGVPGAAGGCMCSVEEPGLEAPQAAIDRTQGAPRVRVPSLLSAPRT